MSELSWSSIEHDVLTVRGDIEVLNSGATRQIGQLTLLPTLQIDAEEVLRTAACSFEGNERFAVWHEAISSQDDRTDTDARNRNRQAVLCDGFYLVSTERRVARYTGCSARRVTTPVDLTSVSSSRTGWPPSVGTLNRRVPSPRFGRHGHPLPIRRPGGGASHIERIQERANIRAVGIHDDQACRALSAVGKTD